MACCLSAIVLTNILFLLLLLLHLPQSGRCLLRGPLRFPHPHDLSHRASDGTSLFALSQVSLCYCTLRADWKAARFFDPCSRRETLSLFLSPIPPDTSPLQGARSRSHELEVANIADPLALRYIKVGAFHLFSSCRYISEARSSSMPFLLSLASYHFYFHYSSDSLKGLLDPHASTAAYNRITFMYHPPLSHSSRFSGLRRISLGHSVRLGCSSASHRNRCLCSRCR